MKIPYRIPCGGGCGKLVLRDPPSHIRVRKLGFCRDCARKSERANLKAMWKKIAAKT